MKERKLKHLPEGSLPDWDDTAGALACLEANPSLRKLVPAVQSTLNESTQESQCQSLGERGPSTGTRDKRAAGYA